MTLAIFLQPKAADDPDLGITDAMIAKIQKALPWLDVVVAAKADGSDLLEQGVFAEIIMVFDVESSFLQYCRKNSELRWIHNILSGSEHILSDSYLRSLQGLIVTNSSGIHGKPMADHIMAAILFFTRSFGLFLKNKREHQWIRTVPDETEGKVLGIIGMGQIGRIVAQRAKAFGMTILGVKRTPEVISCVDQIFSPDNMDEVLRRSDFLVLLTPYSTETHNLMNAERFALMKPSCFFINVGRGKCCDSTALYNALNAGGIAGALIDAYDPEPMTVHDPLWDLDNVIITPHISASSPFYMNRMIDLFIQNAQRFHVGEPLLTPVSF